MLRKCGLFALSFAVLSTSFSVFFSDVSNALTNPIDITDKAILGANPCTTTDLTENWSEILLNESSDFYYKKTLDYINNPSKRSTADNFATEFATKISNGDRSGWGVFTTGGSTVYIAVFDADTSFSLTENPSNHITYLNSSKIVKTMSFDKHAGESCKPYIRETQNEYTLISQRTSFPVSNNNFKILFLSTDNITYPVDYDGPLIPDGSIDNRELIQPDFKYIASGKSFTATDYNLDLPTFTPDEGYTFEGYKVEWTLFKCAGDSPGDSCNSPIIADHQILLQSNSFKKQDIEYGKYYIEAQYLVEQCYRYPSYPTTPDYCFYVDLNTEFSNYHFLSKRRYLKLDGSTVVGDTRDDECDEGSFCQPGKSTKAFYNYFNERDNHGLTAILLSPLFFYQQLPSMAQKCTPITFSLLGQTIALECLKPRYQAWSPFILGVWSSIVNAVVAYAVALGVFRTIKNVNDPHDDRIEVKTL